MENENKWEYDYSDLYGAPPRQSSDPAPGTGYVNVGSSGTNAANQYNTQDGTRSTQSAYGTEWTADARSAPEYSTGGSGASYGGSQTTTPPPQKKPRKKPELKGWAKTALTLLLAAAVGFGGGWLGAAANGGTRVVVQSVQRDTTGVSATSTSTGGNDLTLTQVSALVSPSVVVITTEAMVSTGSWFGLGQVESGAGSGVIMSSDGYILTCAHVISGASNIIVTIDNIDYTANLIGEDAESDIAVIKIAANGLTPAVMADSDTLAVGEEVVAVGNPLGELGGTVTNGIVSALNRDVVVDNNPMSLIQTNASVSPGNSGGGLFNMAGELIGIVNAKSADADAEGLGFAIPVNKALEVARQLIETGYVSGRPALGVTVLQITDAETAAYYGVTNFGVYIADVTKGGGADKAGLQVGDRIISINGNEVSASTDLTDVISECAVGDVVTLNIARSGQILTVDVTLGDRNATNTTQQTTPQQSEGQLPSIPGFGGNGRG